VSLQQPHPLTQKTLLTIAGSDSGSGAGIQADLKTASAFGVYASTAITALTAQNTLGTHSIHLPPAQFVKAQIEAVLSDIGADIIKLGMLGNGDIAKIVADCIVSHNSLKQVPLVIDPVLSGSDNTPLSDNSQTSVLLERLLPLATLITPNIPEAEALTNSCIQSISDMEKAAKSLQLIAGKNTSILITGGHLPNAEDTITDVLWHNEQFYYFSISRQNTSATHGTGCTLATGISCGIALGKDLIDAIKTAQDYLQQAIQNAPHIGSGAGPLNHIYR